MLCMNTLNVYLSTECAHVFDEWWTQWISLQLVNVSEVHCGESEWHSYTRSRDKRQKCKFHIVMLITVYYNVSGSCDHLDFLPRSSSIVFQRCAPMSWRHWFVDLNKVEFKSFLMVHDAMQPVELGYFTCWSHISLQIQSSSWENSEKMNVNKFIFGTVNLVQNCELWIWTSSF